MPHGKYAHHKAKGRARQFTPADELQREFELGFNRSRSSETEKQSNSSDQTTKPPPKSKSTIENLIKISNPNRIPREAAKIKQSLDSNNKEATSTSENRRRDKEKARVRDMQKLNEAKADLARLALIRKEREEAAQRRLAAKKETAAVTPSVEELPMTSAAKQGETQSRKVKSTGRKKAGRKGK